MAENERFLAQSDTFGKHFAHRLNFEAVSMREKKKLPRGAATLAPASDKPQRIAMLIRSRAASLSIAAYSVA